MEVSILLTHISFLILVICQANENNRIYFELSSFYSILGCIELEYLFIMINLFKTLLIKIKEICKQITEHNNSRKIVPECKSSIIKSIKNRDTIDKIRKSKRKA